MNAIAVSAVAVTALIVSLIADRRKTWKAIRIAVKRFVALLPSFLAMLAGVSIALTVFPEERVVQFLGGDNTVLATVIAAVVGSLTLMPGFIAFPLAGLLVDNGVAFMVVSAFTTTLMLVGVLTYPIEKQYFGRRVTILRNLLSFAAALLIAVATGLYFGEIP